MTTWLHSTILATAVVATAAIGIATAANLMPAGGVAARSDRLSFAADANTTYRTVETRSNGVSVLTRMPITQ